MDRPGWHQREYLPHYDGPEVIQHIVFRLADSLPASFMDDVARLKPDEQRVRIDRQLDGGDGQALLAHDSAAQIVAEALKHFDGSRYALHAWCVMPNHVHVVMQPLGAHQLGAIVRSWKAYSAAQINKAFDRTGRLWAPDYFDRFMRNEEQLQTVISYVENNPVLAGLCAVPQDWRYSSAFKERA